MGSVTAMPRKAPVFRPHVLGISGKKEFARSYDQERRSAHRRGYDAAWQKVRLQHLKAEPLCRHCLERGEIVVATDVDHIIPIRIDPDLRLDDSNLQSLCHYCHSKKTQLESKCR